MHQSDYAGAAADFSRHGTLWFESAFCREMPDGALLFTKPDREMTLTSPESLEGFFGELESALDEGYWLAGWLSYEAGYGFERKLLDVMDRESLTGPLAWFGAYRGPRRFSEGEAAELFRSHPALFPFDRSGLSMPVFSLDEGSYTEKLLSIRDQIARGNVYQVNFTGRYRFSCTGKPEGLFSAMRRKQPVSYTAFVNNGAHTLLSFSPELFFRSDGRTIETMPMKGTAPRGADNEEDRQFREQLGNCAKNRAENLMIVDLLRNDLGRVCRPGTVETERLFQTETYPTLHQMISTVRGELKENVGLSELFRSIFPSGSVTGAPKIRAMQLIRELEDVPRGIYTGSIGFISPERRMVFNVAIRTIELHGTQGHYGSGSGVVWDSQPHDEFLECRLKARILSDLAAGDFSLFETILWAGEFLWLEEHLQRMASSAETLGFAFTKDAALLFLRKLEDELHSSGRRFRVRFTLSRDGSFSSASDPVEPSLPEPPVSLCLARDRVDSSDPLILHKTTRRELYDRYFAAAAEQGYADAIFLNERGELCEGAISSIFIRMGERYFTPPIPSGLLPGVFRSYFLSTRPGASEKVLTLQDLFGADMVCIGNSVRGLRQAIFTGRQISA